MRTLALVVLVLGLGSGVNENNREGVVLYEQNRLDEALDAFARAQAESPDAFEIYYNIGNVYYRKRDREAALAEYRAALSGNEETRRRAHFNMGNVHYRGEDYDSAVEAYKGALKIDPDDVEARQNLELALRRREQQQEEQDQEQEQAGGGGGGGGGGESEQNQEEEQQEPEEQPRSESPVSRQEAERILAALAEMEKDEIGRQQENKGGPRKKKGKDW